MKFIRTNKRVIAGALALIFTAPVFGGTMEIKPKEEELKDKMSKMESDPFFKKSLENQESTTYKIYNQQDELVYESTQNATGNPDVKLVKLLNGSDFLASDETISYFRLNE
ncbi:hypothetical protein [Fulvivirga lutea]|uniref:Uncharacterized protein n=1 Tax=Fulvivirga lutea TaxID=2810512 RepID=A0A974WI48_9BACT|nr:hypothetical protein [Fulvivirga lutea]QSE98983.1 hypothetical protein JR347_07830 [Fulvivirga lutea]